MWDLGPGPFPWMDSLFLCPAVSGFVSSFFFSQGPTLGMTCGVEWQSCLCYLIVSCQHILCGLLCYKRLSPNQPWVSLLSSFQAQGEKRKKIHFITHILSCFLLTTPYEVGVLILILHMRKPRLKDISLLKVIQPQNSRLVIWTQNNLASSPVLWSLPGGWETGDAEETVWWEAGTEGGASQEVWGNGAEAGASWDVGVRLGWWEGPMGGDSKGERSCSTWFSFLSAHQFQELPSPLGWGIVRGNGDTWV